MDSRKIDVLIPARNERDNIMTVINVVRQHIRVNNVHVMVDADTIDDTMDLVKFPSHHNVFAHSAGTTGKGQVIKAGLHYVTTSRVAFVDADIKNLNTIHVDMLTARDVADMIVLIPALPQNLDDFDKQMQERICWSWPYVSGQRTVPTEKVAKLDLHGYLMETQINQLAHAENWSVYYQPTQIVSELKLTTTRLIEMERDRKWGQEHAIL